MRMLGILLKWLFFLFQITAGDGWTQDRRNERERRSGRFSFSFPLSVFGFLFPLSQPDGIWILVQNSQDQRVRESHSGWKLWSYHWSRSLLLPPWEICANITAWSSCSVAKVCSLLFHMGIWTSGVSFGCCFFVFVFFLKKQEAWSHKPLAAHGNLD